MTLILNYTRTKKVWKSFTVLVHKTLLFKIKVSCPTAFEACMSRAINKAFEE